MSFLKNILAGIFEGLFSLMLLKLRQRLTHSFHYLNTLFSSMSNLTGYVSREQRIKKVLQSSPWIFFDDYSDLSKVSSPVQDTIDILAIVVTTVMLLAADYNDISNNHLRWTYSYLSCIKDESGHTPPNIKGIMNHIKLKNNEIDSFIEDDTVLSVNEVEEAHIEPDDNKEDAAAAPAEENAPADK